MQQQFFFLTRSPLRALAHGISHLVGSIEVGKVADLVAYSPAFFGSKPEFIMKSGIIVWGQMGNRMTENTAFGNNDVLLLLGDANGSISTTQPIQFRPMYGNYASSISKTSMVFVSELSITTGTVEKYGLRKRVEAVKNCRRISKRDMKLNNAMPTINVDPETYAVTADGEACVCDPVDKLPMTQSIYLF